MMISYDSYESMVTIINYRCLCIVDCYLGNPTRKIKEPISILLMKLDMPICHHYSGISWPAILKTVKQWRLGFLPKSNGLTNRRGGSTSKWLKQETTKQMVWTDQNDMLQKRMVRYLRHINLICPLLQGLSTQEKKKLWAARIRTREPFSLKTWHGCFQTERWDDDP